jgi:hypothetical protein
MEVLQIKVTETEIDSVFLGGQPAPPTLLDAFGVTQGETQNLTFYVFYKPDFGDFVLSIRTDIYSTSWNPQAEATISSTADMQVFQGRAFPNPIAPGDVLTLESPTHLAEGTFFLTDLQGRVVFETPARPAGGILQLPLPGYLAPGMYYYHLVSSQNGNSIVGKVSIQK